MMVCLLAPRAVEKAFHVRNEKAGTEMGGFGKQIAYPPRDRQRALIRKFTWRKI